MTDAEPRTEAGRRMLANHERWGQWYQHNWLAAILAIEAEAGAAPLDVERLRAEIAEEMAGPDNPDDLFEQGCLAAYNWVLARLCEGTEQ